MSDMARIHTETVDVWLGHFPLDTLAIMIADMAESVSCSRELATDREGLEDFGDTLNNIVEAADDVTETLRQIAIIVAYCEASYGKASTDEALAEVGAEVDVIEEAQHFRA